MDVLFPPSPSMLGVATGVSALTFAAVRRALFTLLPRFKFFTDLPPPMRKKFVTYGVSMVHAVACTGSCFYRMAMQPWLRITPSPGFTAASYETNFYIVSLSLGYFTEDFRTLHRLDEYFHHSVLMVLLGIILATKPGAPLAPYGMCLEFSTLFVNAMWMLRDVGRRNSRAYTVSKVLFALSFFTFRIAWLGYLIARVQFTDEWLSIRQQLGPSIWLFVTVWCLQMWWFVKIVRVALQGPRSLRN